MPAETHSTTIILCFLSLAVFITGFWFKYKPPKKINMFFGYRTKNSMKGQEQWDFAHRYSGRLFILFGAILSLLALIVAIFNASSHNLNLMTVLFFVLGSFVIIFKTEKAINKKFDN